MYFHCSTLAQTKAVCLGLKWDLVYGFRCLAINIVSEFITRLFALQGWSVSTEDVFPRERWPVLFLAVSCNLSWVHSHKHTLIISHTHFKPQHAITFQVLSSALLASNLNSPVMSSETTDAHRETESAQTSPITVSKNKLMCYWKTS